MKELRRLFYVVIDDWADNWKRYVRDGILLFVFVQLLHACVTAIG